MWIVICWADEHVIAASYGPFYAEPAATRFADFLTKEVNPATVERLCSPLTEVLNWREAVARDAS